MVKLPPDNITAKDVSILDENSKDLGIPTILLMETAGGQAAELIVKEYKLDEKSKVAIFCGTGNNGGDGFVIARHLASRGIFINLILVGDPDKIRTEEAKTNWQILHNLTLNIFIFTLSDSSMGPSVEELIKEDTLIIDCILGTGVNGKNRQPISCAIDIINNCTIPKIAIDVPSGMDPTTGAVPDKAVKCDFLITFHRNKTGLGNIVHKTVVPIGIAVEAGIFVGDGDLRNNMPHRIRENFKGQFGKVLVIGGSNTYSGAPSFASLAALELGIDLCITFVPKSISSVVRGYSPHIIVREGSSTIFTLEDISLADELISWADAILIGPGLGSDPKTQEFFEAVFPKLLKIKKPTVVDADGLKFLGKAIQSKKIKIGQNPVVLTPHLGELKALKALDQIPSFDDIVLRGTFLMNFVNEIGGGVILLKGVNDYIADNSSYRVNRTGVREMAVGGTGDILAGLTVAFLSLGLSPKISACIAAYLNGRLGQQAVEHHGFRIQALDLITELRPFLRSKKL